VNVAEDPKPISLGELAECFQDGAASAETAAVRALSARLVVLTAYVARLSQMLAKVTDLCAKLEGKAHSPGETAPTEAKSDENETAEMVAKVQAETLAEAAAVQARNGKEAQS
jgi:hypothetical protein